MAVKIAISGGFGDVINEFAKIYQLAGKESVEITYHRDLTDNSIIKDREHVSSALYESWARDVAERQGWTLNVVYGHVNEYFEAHHSEFDHCLGNIWRSDINIPDASRGGIIGRVPHETWVEPTLFPVPWKFDKLELSSNALAVHTEFADERQNPTRGWTDIQTFIGFLTALRNYYSGTIYFFGRTSKENLDKVHVMNSAKVKFSAEYLNKPVLDQYNLLLNSNAIVAFSGWSQHLGCSAGIKTYCFVENEVARALYVANLWREKGSVIEYPNNQSQHDIAKLICRP